MESRSHHPAMFQALSPIYMHLANKWKQALHDLLDTQLPDKQLILARNILQDGPIQTWNVVFALVQLHEQHDTWAAKNPFMPLSGQLRACALQLLKQPSTHPPQLLAQALSVLCMLPRFRDLPVVLSSMEQYPQHRVLLSEGRRWLRRIAYQGKGREAPLLISYIESQLHKANSPHPRLALFELLAIQNSPFANQRLGHFARTASFQEGGMDALQCLLYHSPLTAQPIATNRQDGLLQALRQSDLSPQQQSQRKQAFLDALAFASDTLHEHAQARDIARQIESLLQPNAPADEPTDQALIRLVATHLGHGHHECNRMLLELCLQLQLATPETANILGPKIEQQLSEHPVIAAQLLLAMGPLGTSSDTLKQVEAMVREAIQDDEETAHTLALPLFAHTNSANLLADMLTSPFVSIRKEGLDWLRELQAPPHGFETHIENALATETDEEQRQGLQHYLDRFLRWRPRTIG